MHSNRVALVTGANKGLGYQIARRLAKEGLTVIIGARNLNYGEISAQMIREEKGEAYAQVLDVSDQSSVESAVSSIEQKFGRLDVLVNNAGVLLPDSSDSMLSMPINELEKTFNTNSFGALRMMQRVIPIMERQKYGRIVNISSSAGTFTSMETPEQYFQMQTPAYRASKCLLNVLTLMIAHELHDQNVLINACCPGWLRTEMGGPEAPKTPEEGADTPCMLAMLPDGGPSGRLFSEREEIEW